VTSTPTFIWQDDSSEDSYTIQVYDAYGTLAWKNNAIASVTGNKNVTVAYAGPALESGMVYQFRATSSKAGCELSRTEDLRGVFKMQ
jgi:hypothetical protein